MKTAHSIINKTHGVISLGILDITMVIAIYAISKLNVVFGLIYFVSSISAFTLIIAIFCTKCNSNHNCSHVYPGRLTRFFKDKRKEAYTTSDYLITAMALAFVFLAPQYWLWQSLTLFIAYWCLSIAAVVIINRKVCNSCKNKKCAMCVLKSIE